MDHQKKILKKRFLKLSKEEIEPQEVFLNSLSKKREEDLGIPERKFEVLLSKRILKFLFLFILIVIALFFIRTFQFQIIKSDKYKSLAEENKFFSYLIEASRGVIYDSQGAQIAFNKPTFDLILNKNKLPSGPEKEKILKEVSQNIGLNIDKLKNKIKAEKKETVLISENLNHQTLILLETKIKNLPGVEIKQNSIRYYPDSQLFSHLIGYTGRINSQELKDNPDFYTNYDYVGRSGLEKTYEKFLRKNPGKVQVEKDAHGNIVSKKIISLPESGKSLVLWLDAKLQKKAQEALKETLSRTGAKKGVVIALNPNNGGILSLVSVPSFDNNLFNKGADQKALKDLLLDTKKNEPFLNRAIAGLYPTGSIIKPLVASAALEEKIISASKKLDCQGKIIIPNKYNPDKVSIKKDWAVHGWTDIRKAIAESCDVYFYTIGGGYGKQIGLGPSKIRKYLQLFGWEEKTGIDLPGEKKGFVPSPQWKKKIKGTHWWDGDTYNLAIGQGDVLITPIEVATAFGAIANGGTLYRPKIVKQILDNHKKLIKKILPEVERNNFINQENLKVVRQGMRQAVTGKNSPLASSVLLNSLPVPVAAKTGTAETPLPNHYHNWVAVFAPYDNPQIVLVILIENVKGLQAAALPTAKEILKWYFSEDRK